MCDEKGVLSLAKEINYYVSGNTSKGYVNYLNSNMVEIKNVIILNHSSFTLKTKILKELIRHYSAHNEIELIRSPYALKYLSGIVIRGKSTAIITDEIATTEILPTMVLNLEEDFKCIDGVTSMKENTQKYMNAAYGLFSKGLAVHDELEAIYIGEMDFTKANELTNHFIKKLLDNVKPKKQEARISHRFFGTTTADGAINVLPKLIKDIYHRVYIKGRAGTGKSVFMKKVARACINLGLDTELYHCSFDPESLDMVLIPELNFCVFDSTDPHELSPEKPGDVIVDLYEEAVNKGTDEKYLKQITEINKLYKSFIHQGIDKLKDAQLFQGNIEKQFKMIDEKRVKEVTNAIIKHIM